MDLLAPDAEIYVPDGSPSEEALSRTTHLGVGAHADDLELLAIAGILACFRQEQRWFTGVVVTDGAGRLEQDPARASERRERALRRRAEQREAAALGEYAAVVQLGFPSEALKATGAPAEDAIRDLGAIVDRTRPQVLYTHSLADEHDTHVAVTLRVLEACRRLPSSSRPRQIIGCEVWRDLDWLVDDDKVVMPLDREELQATLIAVFTSQVTASKRYDLAALGRRRAHATFLESHASARHEGVAFGMDLTPLIDEPDPRAFIGRLVQRFEADVRARLERAGG